MTKKKRLKKSLSNFERGMIGTMGVGLGLGASGAIAGRLGAPAVAESLGGAATLAIPIMAGVYTAKFAHDTLVESSPNKKKKGRAVYRKVYRKEKIRR